MRTDIFIISSFFIVYITACKSQLQPHYVAEHPYNLENIDLNLKPSIFFSTLNVKNINWKDEEKNKEYYKHTFSCKEKYAIDDTKFEQDSSLKYFYYEHVNWSKDDQLAVWGNVYFNKLNMIADDKDSLVAIAAVAEGTTQATFDGLVALMDKALGKPEKSYPYSSYDLYTWKTPAYEIYLVPHNDDKKNTVVVTVTENGTEQSNPPSQFDIYFYIITTKQLDNHYRMNGSSDFRFCAKLSNSKSGH